MDDAVAEIEDDAPPRWARVLSYSLIGLILVFGVFHVEAWPFSAFKLFSGMRGDTRVSYQVRTVDSDGDEAELAFGELPVAYRNTHVLIPDFDTMSQAERDEICNAWAQTPRDAGEDVALIRIYRYTDNVWPDGPETEVEAVYECGAR